MAFSGGSARGAQWLAAIVLAGCVYPDDPGSGASFGGSGREPFAGDAQPEAAAPTNDLTEAPLETGPDAHPPGGAAGAPTRTADAANVDAANPVAAVAATPNTGGAAADGAGTAEPGSSPERGNPSQPVPGPPAASLAESAAGATAAGDRGLERKLRNAYANATEVTEPALNLASFLVRKERYPEALFIVDQAIERERSPGLRMARAGLLRDIARNDLAMEELRGVVLEKGRERVAAGTLLELAQVEWLAGDRDAADATMRDLLRMHADRPFLRDNAEVIRDWHTRIQNKTPATDGGDLRDAYALLRAAPVVTGRIRILDGLARPPRQGADDERRLVRLRAIGIACADESAAVRTRAVQLADANDLHNLAFWRAAVADSSPLVRRFGAYGLARQHGEEGTDALLQAMAKESDAAAFTGMHAAMAAILKVDAPPCAAEDEAGRANAVAMWRKRCER